MKRRDLLKMGLASSLSVASGGMALAAEPASRRSPNVLWLMTDEQRKDSLGCYGAPWAHSPNLDRLAREGVVFTSAYTPSPVCCPARVSLLTGQHCTKTSVWNNIGNHDLEFDFLTDVFRDAGYASASFGKQHYMGPRKAFDYERHLVISPAVDFCGYAKEYDEAKFDVVKHPTGWVLGGRYPGPIEETVEWICVEEAEQWLQSLPRRRPFLLRISFGAPHTPVVPPPPFDTLISEDDIALPAAADPLPPKCSEWMRWLSTWSGSAPLTAEQTRKMRRYYYGYCAFVDAQFERLIDWMQSNGFLDNTIIAFVSDHGTHLCDHGLVQKNTFYEPSVSVPYFFRYPGHIASGRIFSTPVETLSLLPTALELAGLHVPTCLADSSLAKSIRGGTEPPARPVFSGIAHRDWSGFCGCPPARPVFSDLNHAFDPRHPDKRLVMVRDGNWKLTACVDDLESRGELVNLADDPFEQRNLFGAPEFQSVQDRLWVLIRDHVSGTPRPCANVRLLGALPRGDAGDVLCPLCRRDMVQRVDGIPDWSDDLTAAYQCSYCGTRFGTKP